MDNRLYKIVFYNYGKVYEIFAGEVSQPNLYGFIEIGQLQFEERSDVIVDPSEEKVKEEFKDVKRFYIPMHAVIRIDEVEKKGVSKVEDAKEGDTKVTPFPIYTPGNHNN